MGDPLRLLRKLVQKTSHDRSVRAGQKGVYQPHTGELARPGDAFVRRISRKPETDLAGRSKTTLWMTAYHGRGLNLVRITVPFLSSAIGGQGLHPRGKISRGLPRRPPPEVAGGSRTGTLDRILHPVGVALQKRFFDHFLKGIDNGWKESTRVQLQVRRVDGFVQRSRMSGLWLEPAGPGSTSILRPEP